MCDRIACGIIASGGGAVMLASVFGAIVGICWFVMGTLVTVMSEVERRRG